MRRLVGAKTYIESDVGKRCRDRRDVIPEVSLARSSALPINKLSFCIHVHDNNLRISSSLF